MNDKEFVLDAMQRAGLIQAQALQERSPDMTGTELYAAEDYIPDFKAAVAAQNMLDRKAGQTDGFVCRSSAGRVVYIFRQDAGKTPETEKCTEEDRPFLPPHQSIRFRYSRK